MEDLTEEQVREMNALSDLMMLLYKLIAEQEELKSKILDTLDTEGPYH